MFPFLPFFLLHQDHKLDFGGRTFWLVVLRFFLPFSSGVFYKESGIFAHQESPPLSEVRPSENDLSVSPPGPFFPPPPPGYIFHLDVPIFPPVCCGDFHFVHISLTHFRPIYYSFSSGCFFVGLVRWPQFVFPQIVPMLRKNNQQGQPTGVDVPSVRLPNWFCAYLCLAAERAPFFQSDPPRKFLVPSTRHSPWSNCHLSFTWAEGPAFPRPAPPLRKRPPPHPVTALPSCAVSSDLVRRTDPPFHVPL